MDKASLERMVQTHRAYSESLGAHFARLWQRGLTQDEEDTIASATLCCSFMSLESIDNGLSVAKTAEKADEDYAFIALEVARHKLQVVTEVKKRLGPKVPALDPAGFANLLAWERALLESIS